MGSARPGTVPRAGDGPIEQLSGGSRPCKLARPARWGGGLGPPSETTVAGRVPVV